MTKYMQIHPYDNVGVSADTGMKNALRDIKCGEEVIKYGFPIGHATADIKKGELVHSHNLCTSLSGEGKWEFVKTENKQEAIHVSVSTFEGYLRPDGRAGTRNEVWIIPTVGCINGVAEKLASLHGAKALTHPYGCSQLGGDLETTQKVLSGLIKHPNAGGVLVLGLGCENNNIDEIKKALGEYSKERIRFLNLQDTEDDIASGSEILDELKQLCKKDVRSSLPISKLCIGVKCGGSDGYSGITANPLVGRISDMLTAAGGTVLMTEIPEMFGAEEVLLPRCKNKEVFDKASSMIQNFRNYFISHGESIAENPSPGNIVGGITTLEEKSLGCVQKGGKAEITGALNYGETPKGSGLYIVDGPGNDIVAVTNLTAAGANLILFTTGRGTPLSAPVPTMKITTNSGIAAKKPRWIDFDAGVLLSGMDTESLAEELFKKCIAVSEGESTKAEENGYYGIAIFKDGITL